MNERHWCAHPAPAPCCPSDRRHTAPGTSCDAPPTDRGPWRNPCAPGSNRCYRRWRTHRYHRCAPPAYLAGSPPRYSQTHCPGAACPLRHWSHRRAGSRRSHDRQRAGGEYRRWRHSAGQTPPTTSSRFGHRCAGNRKTGSRRTDPRRAIRRPGCGPRPKKPCGHRRTSRSSG